ncbi:MAG TPA: alpha-E domain-containing protein [Acidimicrobiia bacterium]|nr:alpha-E domain-containing protein [Acidimicrobiia bacterium]
MLSRHAEDLYWLGRYIERAEDTARMLDVTYHNLLESPAIDETRAWKELLEVLFLDAAYPGPLEGRDVSSYLVTERANQGSIISAVARARDNARGLRDGISTELWEAINVFYLELARADFEIDIERRAYEIFSSIRSRCQLVSGVAAQTMPRDEGYRFMLLGWMLERAEMTCRLLAVRYARLAGEEAEMGFHTWASVLKSVSAYEAYLKAHDASLNPTKVLEFLLLSQEFPRSVLYCLQLVERLLERLAESPQQTPVERAIGRVRARAEFCDISVIVNEGLDQFLEELQKEIYDVSEEVEEHFFRAGTDLQLHSYRWA